MSDNLADSKDIAISKGVLAELPSDFEETSFGNRRGARKQYRSSSSDLHVREYDDKFTIHIDRVDPRKNPIGHLIRDSPETIAAAVTSLYFAKRSFGKRGVSRSKDSGSFGLSLLGLLVSFVTLNGIFRFLKRVLFG